MHPIIYDVAVSLDGFICGPAGDISAFAPDGPVVDDYRARLATYAVAIMGRRTYEFGYAFGLAPGHNPYPHMKTLVFSRTLALPAAAEVSVVTDRRTGRLRDLKTRAGGPIYLCGGGAFAGWVLRAGLIDRLVVKRAPHVLGAGVALFGGAPVSQAFARVRTSAYQNGYLLEEFEAVRPAPD